MVRPPLSVYTSFLTMYFSLHFCDIEVLLNSRGELVDCMMNEGLLHAIGDIVVSETDSLTLVCSIPS